MYTLIRDLNDDTYAIIHFPTFSWGPGVEGLNWFYSIAETLDVAFNSNQPFCVEEPNDQFHMADFTSVEDYCMALQAHPTDISPEVTCHFESPENFFEQFPELLSYG